MEGQGRVVELKFLQRRAKVFVVISGDRVDGRENHLLRLFEARQSHRAGIILAGDGVARLGIGECFHAGNQIADLSGGQAVALRAGEEILADLLHFVLRIVVHEDNGVAGPHRAVDNAHGNDRAPVGIIVRVKDQGLQRRVRVAFRRWQMLDNRLQYFLHAEAGLGRAFLHCLQAQAKVMADFFGHLLRLGSRQINLVDHRNDLQIVLHCQIEVGQGLRFHALSCIN